MKEQVVVTGFLKNPFIPPQLELHNTWSYPFFPQKHENDQHSENTDEIKV